MSTSTKAPFFERTSIGWNFSIKNILTFIFLSCFFSVSFDELDWQGENILVMNKITVSPPYKPENVKGVGEKAVAHVRKIVSTSIPVLA